MHTSSADSLLNPYTSPTPDTEIVKAELVADSPKPGSLFLVLIGFVLLLVGYFTSNLFAIADLYQVGFGPDGEVIPSPFSGAFGTPALAWLFYVLCASATVAGCILIGSQRFNPLCAVIFFMCPIAALVFAAGWPLRITNKYTFPIAALYLMVGTCLAGAGILRLINLYGATGLEFEPILASLMAEVGLALAIGAGHKLARMPQV